MLWVSCGNFHSLFLDTEGNVWSSGLNNYGQLGLGNSSQTYSILKKIKGITCNYGGRKTFPKSARSVKFNDPKIPS